MFHTQGGRPPHHRRGGQLADGYVIRMTICAVGIECHHHLRSHAAQMVNNAANRFLGVGLVHFSILIAQATHLVQTKHLGGGSQFTLAYLPQRTGARIFVGARQTTHARPVSR